MIDIRDQIQDFELEILQVTSFEIWLKFIIMKIVYWFEILP